MSEIFRMLGGDGVAEKWEAMKNIEEPNSDRSSEFVCIGINYDEACAIQLSCKPLNSQVCVRARACVCVCVCVVGGGVCM
jgi:hypothetical protein